MPERVVHCEDAPTWLRSHTPTVGTSLVASLPDISEFGHDSLPEWSRWFRETAELVLRTTPEDGVTIFFQSDIKREGTWVDKGHLCQSAAEKSGHTLLWHKIVCRAPVGQATYGRPAYSHLLCFSKNLRLLDLNLSSPDVFAETGEKTWTRGMGLETALFVAKFIATQTPTHTLINPFCGEGSMLAAANHTGLSAIGIERSPKRADKARRQKISADQKTWMLEGERPD